MGASVAYHLAERGVTDVVLVEREPQLGTMSTGRNAGGFRHQFSHAANIELSKESIALFANFEDVVGAADRLLAGRLSLPALVAKRASRRSSATWQLQRAHGVDVDWLTPAEAARLAPGISTSTACSARPSAATTASPIRTASRMGFARAAQQRGVEIVRGDRGDGHSVADGRVTRRADERGTDRHAHRRQRGRAVGERDRPHGRRRRAGRSRAPSHLHRAAAGRRQLGRRRASRQGARRRA